MHRQSATAELIETREVLPGQWIQTYHAPWLASGVRAGQYLQLRMPADSGALLRAPFSVNTYERSTGAVSIHFRVTGTGTGWLARARPGDRAQIFGPLGRPFEVDPRARHVLLVAGGLGVAGVRALADEALAASRRVVLLVGARSAGGVYPSSLLPDEVEYVVATEDGSFGHHGPVTELVPSFEAWADQAFACGSPQMLASLCGLARGRQARMGVAALGARRGRGTRPPRPGTMNARRRAWLQVSVEQSIGCAVGACLGCVITGPHGPQRVCREGPVFAAEEIAWEGDWSHVELS